MSVWSAVWRCFFASTVASGAGCSQVMVCRSPVSAAALGFDRFEAGETNLVQVDGAGCTFMAIMAITLSMTQIHV